MTEGLQRKPSRWPRGRDPIQTTSQQTNTTNTPSNLTTCTHNGAQRAPGNRPGHEAPAQRRPTTTDQPTHADKHNRKRDDKTQTTNATSTDKQTTSCRQIPTELANNKVTARRAHGYIDAQGRRPTRLRCPLRAFVGARRL